MTIYIYAWNNDTRKTEERKIKHVIRITQHSSELCDNGLVLNVATADADFLELSEEIQLGPYDFYGVHQD